MLCNRYTTLYDLHTQNFQPECLVMTLFGGGGYKEKKEKCYGSKKNIRVRNTDGSADIQPNELVCGSRLVELPMEWVLSS